MSKKLRLNPDRLFSPNHEVRNIARELYSEIKNLPIISPHGHTDTSWFAYNKPFENATELLLKPDHYIFRMLYSQGISLETIGLRRIDSDTANNAAQQDPQKAWKIFAENYYLFRGTPTKIWLDWVFSEIFHIENTLDATTADDYYNIITEMLQTDSLLPRNLFDQFNIELLATTEGPNDPLKEHQIINQSGWNGRIITTFRPDPVLDPDYRGFKANIAELGLITNEDTSTYDGYLNALMKRREYFRQMGATATDHGHPSAATAALNKQEATQLYAKVIGGNFGPNDAELFRAHMLTEMARMSIDDGMVMQIHPGCFRNHNDILCKKFGYDKGADIPKSTDYVSALKPLLDLYGNDSRLSIILFTLDETTYSRELAPLAGHYPALKLGPSWWFHDSPEGMRRFRQQVTETAGFYNTVGFNDDTRAFLSIPARHDVARRMDCNFLAELVADHRLDIDEAAEIAHDLTYNLVKRAYKL